MWKQDGNGYAGAFGQFRLRVARRERGWCWNVSIKTKDATTIIAYGEYAPNAAEARSWAEQHLCSLCRHALHMLDSGVVRIELRDLLGL